MIPFNKRLFVRPTINRKSYRVSGGRYHHRDIQKGADIYSFGCYLFHVRNCEMAMNKWRFANFSFEPLPYVANLEAVNSSTLTKRLLPWLRYRSEQWSIEVPIGTQPVQSSLFPKPLICSFSNPKDAMVLRLFGDQILSGEYTAKRRYKRKQLVISSNNC